MSTDPTRNTGEMLKKALSHITAIRKKLGEN